MPHNDDQFNLLRLRHRQSTVGWPKVVEKVASVVATLFLRANLFGICVIVIGNVWTQFFSISLFQLCVLRPWFICNVLRQRSNALDVMKRWIWPNPFQWLNLSCGRWKSGQKRAHTYGSNIFWDCVDSNYDRADSKRLLLLFFVHLFPFPFGCVYVVNVVALWTNKINPFSWWHTKTKAKTALIVTLRRLNA